MWLDGCSAKPWVVLPVRPVAAYASQTALQRVRDALLVVHRSGGRGLCSCTAPAPVVVQPL
jgi:hypothetical protein